MAQWQEEAARRQKEQENQGHVPVSRPNVPEEPIKYTPREAILTGNPADDSYTLGRGTGIKLSVAGLARERFSPLVGNNLPTNPQRYGYDIVAPGPGWEEELVEGGTVFWDPTSSQWGMVYVGYALGPTNGQIGFAWSTDLATWTKDGANPRFSGSGVAGTFDYGSVTGPLIWLDYSSGKWDGIYHLFYIGCSLPGYEQGTKSLAHVQATSIAGLASGKRTQIIAPSNAGTGWRANEVYHPSIVYRRGIYYLFFNALGVVNGVSSERIGYATAPAITGPWTVDDINSPLIYPTAAWEGLNGEYPLTGDPCVYQNGENMWVMGYFGATLSPLHQSDGLAYTTDEQFPLGWTKYANNPVLKPGPAGGNDSSSACKSYILATPHGTYRFYHSNSGIAVAVDNGVQLLLGNKIAGIGEETDYTTGFGDGTKLGKLGEAYYLLRGSSSEVPVYMQIGQGYSHNLYFGWTYNATPANATAEIGTYGGENPLRLQSGGGELQLGGSSAKLSFYGASYVSRPSPAGTITGFVAGSGTAMNSASTSTGGTGSSAYTFGDIVLALKKLGLIAP